MGDIGVLLIIGLAIWGLTKYTAGTSLSFQPRGISFDGGNLVVKLGVINQAAFPISFDSFNGQLTVNGTPAGLIQDFNSQTIAANAETDLNLVFEPFAGQLITDVINFIKNSGAQTIGLTGTLVAENIPININQSFTLQGLPL